MMPAGWRDLVRSMITQHVARVLRFARVAVNTASGDGDAVYGHQPEDDEDEYQYQVRRIWPFGIRSRPPTDVDAVVVHVFGGSTNGVMVGAESPEYGPDDLEDGESAFYSSTNAAVLRASHDGTTAITSASNSDVTVDANGTGDVVVNGGDLKVARDTDPVSINAGTFSTNSLTLNVTDSLGATGTIVITVAAGVLVVTPGGVTPGAFTMTGTITDGASRFKA